jgi:hypothetical protein
LLHHLQLLNHTNLSDPARQRLGLLKLFPLRMTRRDRGLSLFQMGFEKPVGSDQPLNGLASITAARRDCLIGRRL